MNTDQATMRALDQGGSQAGDIAAGEAKRPVPGDGDVLVRVEASAINPFDLSIVLGHDSPTALAYIPGRDMAGIVESGPAELVGTPVWVTGGEFGSRRDGFHAEYAVLPVAGVRRRPDRLSAAEAASVGVAFTTAWYGLVTVGGLGPGDRVLVTGGAGSVGSAAIQIARWRGASQIQALVLNDEQAQQAAQWGASLATPDAGQLAKRGKGSGPRSAWTPSEARSWMRPWPPWTTRDDSSPSPLPAMGRSPSTFAASTARI